MRVEGVEVPTEHFIDGERVGGGDRLEVRIQGLSPLVNSVK